MSIRITITNEDGAILADELVEKDIATIGREKSCDVHVADEARIISRQHLKLEVDGLGLRLTVLSKYNPVVVGDLVIGTLGTLVIPADCTFAIHSFVVRTQYAPSKPPAALGSEMDWMNSAAPPAVAAAIDPLRVNQFSKQAPAAAAKPDGGDPFGNLMPQSEQKKAPDSPWRGKQQAFPSAAELGAVDSFKDLDPMSLGGHGANPSFLPAGSGSSGAGLGAPMNPFPDDIFAGLSELVVKPGTATGKSSTLHAPVADINLPYRPPPVPQAPIVAPDLSPAAWPQTSAASWTDALPETAAAPAARTGALPDASPEAWPDIMPALPEATVPPPPKPVASQPVVPQPVVPQPVVPQPVAAVEASVVPMAKEHEPAVNVDLLQAFFDGLGLDLPSNIDKPEMQMREAGAMLRESIHGIVTLLIARGEIKREIRSEERTMLGVQDNNPLKLTDDPKAALRYLCDPMQRVNGAFLPPVQAIQDACEDLQAHELGLIAGTRAAVGSALRQFAPQQFEDRSNSEGLLQRVNRRARLWDFFIEEYKKINDDQADCIERLIETDFMRAYSEQVASMRKD